MAEKRYWWLQLQVGFFEQREMKKLRRLAGGDTYTIIYLKLQLLSLSTNAELLFAETEDTMSEQLALEVNENVEDVEMTLHFLLANKLIEINKKKDISMIETKELIGSETSTAQRVRRHREKNKMLQCNADVTHVKQNVNGDIDIEKEKEIDIDKEELSKDNLSPILEKWNKLGLQQIKKINKNTNRYKLLKARIKEYGIEDILKAIENISNSNFLKGQNSKGWQITFDWLIKPNNFIKVLEDNYKNKDTDNTPKQKTNNFNCIENRADNYSKQEMDQIINNIKKQGG